jgi:hypothetical protein
MDILLTWVGSRDPVWGHGPRSDVQPGPILSLFNHRLFDKVYLFFTPGPPTDGMTFTERANQLFKVCKTRWPTVDVQRRPIDLVTATDYEEIFRVMHATCRAILKQDAVSLGTDLTYHVYLSPGTPQMQTVWVLLVQSGLLPARMIEMIGPTWRRKGVPALREVHLDLHAFPRILSPGELEERVGVLERQNENLRAENIELRAQIELELPGAQPASSESVPSLDAHMAGQERALYSSDTGSVPHWVMG